MTRHLLLATALLVLLTGCATERVLISQQDATSPHVGMRWTSDAEFAAPSKPKPKAEWQERISTLCSAEAMRLHGMPANGRYIGFADVQKRCLRREYRMHRWERLTWWWPRQTAGGL